MNDVVCNSTVSVNEVDAVDPMIQSKNDDFLEEISPNEEVLRELGSAREAITRLELDIACSSEKLVNLNMLMMHVVEKESDFEAFVSEPGQKLDISVERALEFNLLSGILDSEAAEFNGFVTDIQSEIVNARKIIYLGGNIRESFTGIDEKLRDFEESLKQSLNQISEMILQSAEFQKTLCYCEKDNQIGDPNADIFRNGRLSDVHMRIKMQTAEQQRRVLRMLEKSLARELDLEKKLTDSRLIEDELRMKLNISEQGLFCMEEDIEMAWVKFLEADCVTAILKERTQELINGAKAAKSNYEVLLAGTVSLSEDIKHLQESGDSSKKLDSLEKQLMECENQLGHALVDMEILMEDMKLRVSKAENQAKNMEGRSIMLIETNTNLNEEVGFLRNKLNSSEIRLQEIEKTKIESAEGINSRARIITGLIMQLAMERGHLYNQISWLSEKNDLADKSKQRNKSSYEREYTARMEDESEAICMGLRIIDVSLLNSKHFLIIFLGLLFFFTVYVLCPF